MEDAAGGLDGREWPGMDLAQDSRAHGMRRQPRAFTVADRDFRAHSLSVADRFDAVMTAAGDGAPRNPLIL